jgi:cytochrome b6-f complex iron-sulfur subunit
MMKETNKNNMDKPMPRRKFLQNIWNVVVGIFVLESIAVMIAFIASGTRKKSISRQSAFKVLGRIEDFAPGSVTAFRIDRIYLICNDDGGMMAVSLQCTHLGCAVAWNEDKEEFECPCHASSFNKMGEVISPPAPRALDVYSLKIEGGMVKVDLNTKRQRKSFKASQLTYA